MANTQQLPDEFRLAVVRHLSCVNFESAQQIENRMDRLYSEMNAVDYSYRLLESYSFDEAVLYLPNSLKYMRERRDDYVRVCAAIAKCVNGWPRHHGQNTLLWLLVGEIQNTIYDWFVDLRRPIDLVLAKETIIEHAFSRHEMVPLDALLNGLLEARFTIDNTSVFEFILKAWSHNFDNVDSSAAFLDFALRARTRPGADSLYRSQIVLHTIFDRSLLKRHWDLANEHIKKTRSVEYLNAIHELL